MVPPRLTLARPLGKARMCKKHIFTFLLVTVDKTGQVYFTLRQGCCRRGSAVCSGAIFHIPVAFGRTNPELSEDDTVGMRTGPRHRISAMKYRTRLG